MNKKTIILLLIFLIITGGIAAGVYLVQQQQLIEQEASTPTGTAQIWLTPSTQTVEVGETIAVDIPFTIEDAITGIAVELNYTYSGQQAPLEVTDINIDSDLLNSDSWNFPIHNYEGPQNGQGLVEISGYNDAGGGFTAVGETTLATVIFTAQAPGSITVTVDPEKSVIQTLTTNEDVLFDTASQSYTYTVSGDPQATEEPTAEPTTEPTTTPTTDPTTSPAPTATPDPGDDNTGSNTDDLTLSITYPQSGSTITTTTPTIQGTSSPNASIEIVVDNTTTYTTTANASGNWSKTVTTALSGGSHTLAVTANNATGDELTESVSFTVSTATGDTTLTEAGTTEQLILLTGLGLFLIVAGISALAL